MAKRRNKYPLIEGLKIIDIAAEGKALGKHDDMVVFVPMTAPGDVVDVQITNKRRRFMEGFVTRFVEQSARRTKPFCAHYGDCGGCRWQHIPYEDQLKYKQKQVEDQLLRIGKLELPAILPILPSQKTAWYRNKLEFTFSDKCWIPRSEAAAGTPAERCGALGFHVGGMFDKILDVNTCYLQQDPSNEIRRAIKAFTSANDYTYYNTRSHEGLMRNLVVRTASTGEVMVIVIFGYEDTEKRIALLEHLQTTFPQITSLMYIINEKWNDSYQDQEVITYHGAEFITEEMEGLQFRVGPKSFYQTNSEQAYQLYRVVREAAGLTGTETVYDLYTGTGTIANFVASRAKTVIGVEYVPEAIADAKENSRINGIGNTRFFAGDMKDVLNDAFITANGAADVIILDPPRAGIHEDVAVTILRHAPRKIVYVSCNPSTQARDLAIFDALYRVDLVQPVDMFPHTHHVENVVLLTKRD